MELVEVQLRLLVEKDCSTALPLELDVEQHTIGYLKDFKLDVSLLMDRHKLIILALFIFFTLRSLVDLLLDIEGSSKVCLRDVEILLLVCHFLCKLRQDVFWRNIGKETVSLLDSTLIVLEV